MSKNIIDINFLRLKISMSKWKRGGAGREPKDIKVQQLVCWSVRAKQNYLSVYLPRVLKASEKITHTLNFIAKPF